jgi:hypothetical protein
VKYARDFAANALIGGALVVLPLDLAVLLLLKGMQAVAGLVRPVAKLLPECTTIASRPLPLQVTRLLNVARFFQFRQFTYQPSCSRARKDYFSQHTQHRDCQHADRHHKKQSYCSGEIRSSAVGHVQESNDEGNEQRAHHTQRH